MKEIEKLFTVNSASEQLDVPAATLRDWILKRKIAVVRIGRSVKIPVSELQKIIAGGYTSAVGAGNEK